MDYINGNDYFKVTLDSYLTDFDRKILCELYQPIIGCSALSLFFTLWSKHERKLALTFVQHSIIFSQMHISQTEFTKAKQKLEAMGLLRTFMEEDDVNGNRYYAYVLYAPKCPKDFFDDVLFTGLLIKSIGEEDAMKIALSFTSKHEKDANFKEVTTSFVDVYKPDFDDECYDNGINDIKNGFGRKVRNIVTNFDYESFLVQINSEYHLTKTMFTKSELENVARISTLYGVEELTMSTLVNDSFDGSKLKGKRLDTKKLESLCQKEIKYTKKEDNSLKNNDQINTDNLDPEIALMIKLNSADYMVYLQKGKKPSTADLNIISSLSSEYQLNTDVINCLVYFTIQNCDGKLPKTYIEKVAATLVRCDITNAVDAYQYLYNKKKEETPVENKKTTHVTKVNSKIETKEASSTNSDEIDEDFALRFKNIQWR